MLLSVGQVASHSSELVVIGGAALSRERVCGLAFEQVLKYVLGAGLVAGACSVVVFGNASIPSLKIATGTVGVSLPTVTQTSLCELACGLHAFLQHVGFHITGVDVPFSNYVAGHQDKSHDLVGTILAGRLGPIAVGPATVEIFFTTLPFDSPWVCQKRATCFANLAVAGAVFVAHLFVVMRYGVDAQGVLYARGQEIYSLLQGVWEECWQGVVVPRPLRQSDSERSFRAVMAAMGPALKTKAKGELCKAYVFRKFLDLCGCSTDSDAVVQQARGRGLTSGCKLLASVRAGRGGKRVGTKPGAVWMASWSYLESVFPWVKATR
jgi:hypothetical protein